MWPPWDSSTVRMFCSRFTVLCVLQEGPPLGSVFRGCQVACIGFTFTRDSPLNQIGNLQESLRGQLALVPPAPPLSAVDDSTSPAPQEAECSDCCILRVSWPLQFWLVTMVRLVYAAPISSRPGLNLYYRKYAKLLSVVWISLVFNAIATINKSVFWQHRDSSQRRLNWKTLIFYVVLIWADNDFYSLSSLICHALDFIYLQLL